MEEQNTINRFNIRVYGIILKDDTLLTIHERYQNERMIKLPGGGLEFGEGLIACLERELMEELNLSVQNIRHFYTQSDFIVSKFNKNEQLITIYYLAEYNINSSLKIKETNIDHIIWVPIDENQNPFTLPVDKGVYQKLVQHFNKGL